MLLGNVGAFVLCVRLPADPRTQAPPSTDNTGATLKRQNRMRHAVSLRQPSCETGLSHFSAAAYFPLLARPRRLARANGPKSRRKRTATGSLGGMSAAKSRTPGLNSAPLRRQGRRLNLPGWGAGIRTPEWRYQKPLPYHLATPQCRERAESYAIRARKATTGIGPVLTQFRLLRMGDWAALCLVFSGVARLKESRYRPRSVGV